MKSPVVLICIFGLSFTGLSAQEAKPVQQSYQTAFTSRQQLAAEVEDTADAAHRAIAKLRALPNPSGMPVEAAADFSLAATDIARLLLVAKKPVAAEEFFKAAESRYTEALAGLGARDPKRGAYLMNRAVLRGEYLAKPAEAKEDIAAAVSLAPNNAHLKQVQEALAARRGEKMPMPETRATGAQKGGS